MDTKDNEIKKLEEIIMAGMLKYAGLCFQTRYKYAQDDVCHMCRYRACEECPGWDGDSCFKLDVDQYLHEIHRIAAEMNGSVYNTEVKDTHICKNCGSVTEYPYEDLLCKECREATGHLLYSE